MTITAKGLVDTNRMIVTAKGFVDTNRMIVTAKGLPNMRIHSIKFISHAGYSVMNNGVVSFTIDSTKPIRNKPHHYIH